MRVADDSAVRVPLRWAGSKRKSLTALRQFMPATIEHYIEPFAGSACLTFLINPTNLVLGDINPQLIEFYHFLQQNPKELHRIYGAIPDDESTYYKTRQLYNDAQPSLGRAAMFLYLNRHCFNGIYRVNSKGSFNVPWGGDKVGKQLSESELVGASSALRHGRFLCADFEEVVCSSLKSGAFVYLDPPYASNETRVFREYHEASFASHDWTRLMKVLHKIDRAGAHFLLSYAGDTTFANDLGDWNVGHLDVTRNVGGFRATRRKYREFVATNYKFAS